jgi:hypothetical protein
MELLLDIKKEGLKGNISTITTLAYSTKKEQGKVVKNNKLERYIEPFNKFGENHRLSINQELRFDTTGKLISYNELRFDDLPVESIIYKYDNNNKLIGWEDSSGHQLDYEYVNYRKESSFNTLDGNLTSNKFSQVKTQYFYLNHINNRYRKYFNFLSPNKIKLVMDYHITEDILRFSEEDDPIRGKEIDKITKFEFQTLESVNVRDNKSDKIERIREYSHHGYLQEDYEYGNDGLRNEKSVWFNKLEIPESNDDKLLSDVVRIIRYNEILSNNEPDLLWRVSYKYLKFDRAGNWTELLITRNFLFAMDEIDENGYGRRISNLYKLRVNDFLDGFGREELYHINNKEVDVDSPGVNLESLIDEVIIERQIEYY